MKIFFFFFYLIKYYIKFKSSFLDLFLSIIFSFLFFIEFIFIFIFKFYFFYFIILYKYLIKEEFIFKKRKKIIYVINNNNNIYKKNKIEKNSYIKNIKKTFYGRRIYYGLIIVYIQIISRKIKEKKNYIKYLYFYKLKSNYNILKKEIINYSLYFFYKNYNLIIFLENLKKKL